MNQNSRFVRYCEHKVASGAFQKVGGISLEVLESARKSAGLEYAADSWTGASLAVMHIDSKDELPQVEKEWRTNYRFSNCFIIVRVTDGGRAEFETAEHQKWTEPDGRVAYVLYVRNHEAIENDSGVAQAVLSILPEQADMVFQKSNIIPELLRHVFSPKPFPEIISALSILCQGYLIVCANRGKGKSVPEVLKKWVFENEQDYSDRISQVQKHAFWDVFDDIKNKPGLINMAEKEWIELSGKGEFSTVSELIKIIVSGRDLTDKDLEIAANAYDTMAVKLEGHRGEYLAG